MSSPTSAAVSNQPSSNGTWSAVAPWVVPPVAASLAIVPVFRGMVGKSFEQKGQPIPPMTWLEGVKGGVKAAPTVGAIVGTQMVFKNVLDKAWTKDSGITSVTYTVFSSAAVGVVSAPGYAVYNGQTMGWKMRESLQRFSMHQAAAITARETMFVFGLTAGDNLAASMRNRFGNRKFIDYAAAFVTGAAASIVGHPFDTQLTLLQSKMPVKSYLQLMWGAPRKAGATGGFSVVYKFTKDMLNSSVQPSV